jgi:phospholipid/cholesterol/gamma-HCH transport system ATP-binding protein
MIQYIGVHKAFDFPVLRGVDLSVASGETLAVVGPSGTGKSVLLKTTIGLITPDAGDVRVDGLSVFRGGRKVLSKIRRKIGYVFQNAALFDSMNVLENVSQGLPEEELRRGGKREIVRKVAEALEHVSLDPRRVLAKLPSELSGGMRKRVGLARAIVGRPEILLYDEPVTGLDPVTAGTVHRLIARLADDLRITSVVVTHDVEGALAISDHIALLESGRIRFTGTPQEFRGSEDPLVQSFLNNGAEALEEESDARLVEAL